MSQNSMDVSAVISDAFYSFIECTVDQIIHIHHTKRTELNFKWEFLHFIKRKLFIFTAP